MTGPPRARHDAPHVVRPARPTTPARRPDHAQPPRADELDGVPRDGAVPRDARRDQRRQRRPRRRRHRRGRGFCSGADQTDDGGVVPNIGGLTPPTIALRAMELLDDIILTLRKMHQPVIGAINGAAIGGGLCLSLAFDIRIASSSAYFRAAGINNGLTASELGLSYLLPARSVPPARSRSCSPAATSTPPRPSASGSCRDGAARRAAGGLLRRRRADHRMEPPGRGAHEAHVVVEPRRVQPLAAHEPGGHRAVVRADAHRQLRRGHPRARSSARPSSGTCDDHHARADRAAPALHRPLPSFSTEDPGTWQPLFDRSARGRRRRHRPARGVGPRGVRRAPRGLRPGRAGRVRGGQAADRPRRPLVGAAHHPVGAGWDDVARAPRHQHPHRRAAPAGDARQGGEHARRALGWPARPRGRRGVAARSTTPPDSTSTPAAVCSTTRSPCARRCGASRGRRTPTTCSPSSTSTRCRSLSVPAACRCG